MNAASPLPLLAAWQLADAAARMASEALDTKSARYARGQGPAPSREEHEHAFELCVAASRAALALAADAARARETHKLARDRADPPTPVVWS